MNGELKAINTELFKTVKGQESKIKELEENIKELKKQIAALCVQVELKDRIIEKIYTGKTE